MTSIDFTEWTDAQLDSAERFADSSPDGPALLAEIQRRKDAGTWKTDGSHDRVAALLASSRRRPRRSAR